ncbi:hypothetical protein JJC03_09085 [Flavobacterium oreochromis]|uniref:tyrosine-type recombinase/integrase n=1 Tax=Flavobacterium oreochromis TaxID=2906078 RepID=UPI001CE63177|nr:hypothetical protein [Flavobacterium oreochromis]QYS85393.1 hypothetical protein JJC03_09085 [Flavobacterium oreochromis]
MKKLLFGCSRTDAWVSPEDWNKSSSKKLMNSNWYVQCNFFDPKFKDKYPKGFPYRKKLNKFKTLEERKAAAEFYLSEIVEILDKGYNPITKHFMEDRTYANTKELTPESYFPDALKLAHASLKVAKSTNYDIKYMLNKVIPAIEAVEMDKVKIQDVKRKHIRTVLDYLEETEATFSEHKFNKYRGYLSILFKEMMEFEAVESDVVISIKKRVQETTIREVLNKSERKKVNEHLKNHHPDFWRFTVLFFHSGGRISELLDLKVKDVLLDYQKYRVLIAKGKQYKWVERVIKDVAFDLWEKSLYGGAQDDYVFSKGLIPGPQRIRREQISRRWSTHVKKKLDIKADFYALKHINLDETADMLSMKDAAAMASHKSTQMVEKHYAVGEKERQFIRLKSLNNNFA